MDQGRVVVAVSESTVRTGGALKRLLGVVRIGDLDFEPHTSIAKVGQDSGRPVELEKIGVQQFHR